MARKIVETFKVFKFDELPNASKEKALEKHRDINVSDRDWWEFTYDDWITKLAGMGYDDADIMFRGFWSQGDGASFTATVDIAKWLKYKKLGEKYFNVIAAYENGDISAKIIRISSMYVHENTIDSEILGDTKDEMVNKQVNEIEKLLKEDARELSEQIYKNLEKDHEYLTSDEVIAETFRANEHEFTKDGKIYS